MTLDRLDKPYCNNTLQGATKVTDDRGFLCLRRNLLANGCCDRSKRLTLRHVCSTCSSIFCCQSYEICVSCCLNPINISLWKNVLLLAKIENQLSILSSKSVFELCSSRCRTSSESVINANAYRDPLRKYCFGVDPPELKISYDKDDDFETTTRSLCKRSVLTLSIFLYLFLRLDISLAIVLSLPAELRSISRFSVAVVKVELLAFLRFTIGNLRVGYDTLQRRTDYDSLATQLSNYADMEARISSIVKDIITRMNLSTSTRDPKDSMKNVKLLQHGMLYRDICKNSMVDLPHSTRITMLLREFNRSDNYLLSTNGS
ncbi:unnamed protein product [Hymenolepis diminuta]|uniref:SREBP regulating gene protein n=1 Tax=Hymenolepis diminuta TaxID=6216 RepID=A0A158QDG0_HYMDI|nr:unnamed protein product [Hymenolepis diminuta]